MKKKILLILSLLCALFLFCAVGCDSGSSGGKTDDVSQGGSTEGGGSEGGGSTEGGGTTESYTVSLVFDAELGTITLSPAAENNVYAKGTSVTATVAPLPGRVLSSFEVDGEEKELTGSKYTFTVEKNVTLEAAFENVPMPASILNSLKGKTAFTGDGMETRVYDGYDEYIIDFSYDYKVAFDGELAFRSVYENKMGLYLSNAAYRNVNGKATTYVRKMDGTVTTSATDADFSAYGNPFDALAAEDFIATGDNGYTIKDAQKARAAARVFSGVDEEIEAFTVFTSEGSVIYLTIDTVEKAHGEGISIDYHYTTSYTFEPAEPMDLEVYTAPFPTTPEHASLKAALESAAAAESYMYHVKEDAESNYYVTKNAIYNDETGAELGFILYSDNLVHYLGYKTDKEGGKLTVDEVVQVTVDGQQYSSTSNIDALKPIFSGFAAEMFEPKGEGVFVLREEAYALLPDVAQCIWSFGDDVTMNFAQSIQIKVENNTLKEIQIVTKLFMYNTTFVMTYSGWNATKLPYPIEGEEGEGGSQTPDTPKPPVSSDAPYPAKFIGKYAGGTWSGTKYAVEITNKTITVSAADAPATVTNIGYDAAKGKITLTVNGISCTISAAGEASDTVNTITLAADDNSFSANLERVTEGGGTGTVTIPDTFFGTFEGDDEGKHYVITISASGIEATVDGEAIPVTVTGYNVRHNELEITWNGTACNMSVELTTVTVNGEDRTYPASVSVMAGDCSVNFTIPVKEGTIPKGDEEETPPAAAGKEKFYGTFEGIYSPYDSDTKTTYRVTISKDGITVSIDGAAATVTEVAYNEKDDEFTFKVNGEDYSITNNSDGNTVSEIALFWNNSTSFAYLNRVS